MGIALKHLAEGQRAGIARELFKVTSEEQAKGELHGLCPIHQETNPSFSYNIKKDQYHCFSCGAGGDLLRLWCEVNGHGQKEGFKAFCQKYAIDPGQGDQGTGARGAGGGGGETPLKDIDLDAVWELFPPLPDAWIERLGKIRGWSARWIEILDLRLQTHYQHKKTGALVKIKKPERVAIPIRDAAGKLVNIRLYLPGGGQYKIVSWAKDTGKARLFPAWPLKGDVEEKAGEYVSPVILCEGESDTICALSHGFNAITQTSKLKNWPADHLAPFKGRDVVIAYDADAAGVKYAQYAAQALAGVAKSVRVVSWPAFMGIDASGAVPESHGQDLTDFFVTHGKGSNDFRELIATARAFEGGAPGPDPAGPEMEGIRAFYNFGINKRFSFRPRLLAEKILEEMQLLSDPDTGLMYCWNGKYWEIYNEDHLRKKAILHLGDESQRDRINDAIFQVRILATIPHGRQVNDRIEWICLDNCMLNLHTDEIRPHDPDFYFTNIVPVEFNPDSTRRCERFEQFLETNIQTPEAIAQLQEFTGYCLLRSTDYQKCLYLLGPGADGKTKYMEILNELVGPDNCAAVSLAEIDDHFQRSGLYNKMVNISGEVGSNFIDTEYFKKITTGDKINAAFKHQDAFDFKPYCKLIFAGNILPRVKDNSDGYFRRILPISFKRQFLEGDPDRDPHLLDKLRAELSEIFYWAWCGLKRLVKQGCFTDCEETRALLRGYRRSNNPILCFVEDECTLGENYEIEKVDLFKRYKEYCSENGYTSFGRENFFRELLVAIKTIRIYRPSKDNPERKRKVQNIRLREYGDDE